MEQSTKVDFQHDRSVVELSNSFLAYFKPSTHIDDSIDDEFVFLKEKLCLHLK